MPPGSQLLPQAIYQVAHTSYPHCYLHNTTAARTLLNTSNTGSRVLYSMEQAWEWEGGAAESACAALLEAAAGGGLRLECLRCKIQCSLLLCIGCKCSLLLCLGLDPPKVPLEPPKPRLKRPTCSMFVMKVWGPTQRGVSMM